MATIDVPVSIGMVVGSLIEVGKKGGSGLL